MPSKRFSIWIVVPLFFTTFMLLAQYELYLTVNLVAPPGYKLLHNLSEFFANDHTIVYLSEDVQGFSSTKNQLVKEYARISLGGFPHEKTIVAR